MQDVLPLRPALLTLLIYGYLIYFFELAVLLFFRRVSPPAFGVSGVLLPIAGWLHTVFAVLLLADAISALRVEHRRPVRVAFETLLALAVLWGLQRSMELMALAGF
jgi:hypothetical protein